MSRLIDKRDEYMEECLNSLKMCADLVKNYVPDQEDKQNMLHQIREVTKDYCVSDNQFKRAKRALRETENYINNQENEGTAEVQEIYQRSLSNLPEVQNYQDNRIWQVVDEKIKECFETLPSTSLNASTSEQNESLICSQVDSQVLIDPLTKKPIKKPCKNKICGHVYDFDSITMYMKAKNIIKCPYIGCANKRVQNSHIVMDDNILERRDDTVVEADD